LFVIFAIQLELNRFSSQELIINCFERQIPNYSNLIINSAL
jgi:hypothetical protein